MSGTVRVISCQHVRVSFCLWAIELTRVVRKIPHFGIGIIWRAIPMNFPVFWIRVSGRSVSGYRTSPNLWVQKELVKFRQCTQDTWLCFAKLLREFLGYPPLNLLGDLGDVFLGYSGSSKFCPLLPSGVSLESAANFLLFLSVAIFLEGKLVSGGDWI